MMPPLVVGVVLLRGATATDRAFIDALAAQAFGTYGDYSGVLPEWLGDPRVQTVVADGAGGRSLGFAMLALQRSRRPALGRGGELLAIAVVAEARRCGIGRHLLDEVERRARAAHLRELRLSTAATNVGARRLYASRGFAVRAQVLRFYPSGQSALEMTKRL